MRPKNAAPKGPGPVAKRVPTVQGRPEEIVGQSFRSPEHGGEEQRRKSPSRIHARRKAENWRMPELPYHCTAPRPRDRTCSHFTRARRVPQKESRRVGTRRLPYVGDRVGGLGVRPPALGSVIW
jgi:hypothetical protein